jgi:biopolymer transport protein ExbD
MGAKLGGAGGGSRYNIDSNSEINVTPFVDVMLVLLIIFMVSIPAATVSIKLDMPPAVPPPPGAAQPEPPTFISIQDNESLYLGKGTEAPRPTSLDRLVGGRRRARHPAFTGDEATDDRIFVRANAEVPYNSFMEVLNTLQGQRLLHDRADQRRDQLI